MELQGGGSARTGIRVAEVAWPVVERQLATGAVAVLPVGAASKEHGPHLPLDTDYRQAEWLGRELAARAPVAVWPTLGYGHYPAFVDYPGSCSIEAATFRAFVGDILAGIRHAGACHTLIVNTGISTIKPLSELIATGAELERGTSLVNVYEGEQYRKAAAALEEQSQGGHADELETSIMLAIAPEHVDMSRAQACDGYPIRGVFNRSDPSAPNYSPTGVYGDPTLATAKKGQSLLEAMLHDLIAAVEHATH